MLICTRLSVKVGWWSLVAAARPHIWDYIYSGIDFLQPSRQNVRRRRRVIIKLLGVDKVAVREPSYQLMSTARRRVVIVIHHTRCTYMCTTTAQDTKKTN